MPYSLLSNVLRRAEIAPFTDVAGQLQKMRSDELCKHFIRTGKCERGAACNYTHASGDPSSRRGDHRRGLQFREQQDSRSRSRSRGRFEPKDAGATPGRGLLKVEGDRERSSKSRDRG